MTCSEQIREWAKGHAFDRNRWIRTSIGQTIKSVVQEFGNWKNAPRGDPRKAGRTSISNRKGTIE